jgi:hypothetical protein
VDQEFIENFGSFVMDYCYLPGYGLTGWVIRYRFSLRLVNKSIPEIKRFFTEHESDIQRPDLRSIIETLRDFNSISDLLQTPITVPEHVSHIADGTEPQLMDTYLACPMEQIDDTSYPSGVIRTSTSAVLRASFEECDEEALKSIAAHLSAILRREFMSQEQFIRKYFEREEVHGFLQHKWKEFSTDVARVRAEIPTPDQRTAQALDRLATIAHWVRRFFNLFDVLKLVGNLRPESLREADLDLIVNKVVEHHKRTFHLKTTLLPRTAGSNVVSFAQVSPELHQQLFALACVVEELVTNSGKHSRPRPAGFHIVIAVEQQLEIQVQELDSTDCSLECNGELLRIPDGSWQNYRMLLREPGGLGSGLIDDATYQHGLKVRYYRQESGKTVYSINCRNAEHAKAVQKEKANKRKNRMKGDPNGQNESTCG